MSEFCAEQSLATAEPLAGTAAEETTIWVALQFNGPWGARAVEENELPPAVQGWLAGQLAGLPQSRLLFIRHEREQAVVGRHLFVGVARANDQRLYHLVCPDDEALLGVDVAALVADTAAEHPALMREPLFLVCTNGKRDQCCAKFGLPIYHHLAAQLPAEQVWQCTHIGGHRYAATAVVLPLGVYYGQLTPQRADEMVAASQRGEVMLAGYRGRSCYRAAEQAADYFVRQQTGVLGLKGVVCVEGGEEGSVWEVANGRQYQVRLRREGVAQVLIGCSKQKYEDQTFFYLDHILG